MIFNFFDSLLAQQQLVHSVYVLYGRLRAINVHHTIERSTKLFMVDEQNCYP